MTTTVDLSLSTYAAFGVIVGAAYFMGLWWTLAHLAGARRPVVRLLTSFALRAILAGVAFLAIARVGALPLLVAFAGFLLARVVLVRRWGRAS